MISPPARLARRFVAGEDAASAIAVGKKLKEKGIKATFDLLGEDVLDRDAAKRSAEANKALLRAIPADVERNISIKLSMVGLEIAEDFCLEQAAGILDVAREVGGFVRVDMEGSKHTQRTLDAFRQLRKTHDNVGIVLQAYLHRTEDDVKEAIRRGDRIRLCKGAYKESKTVALQSMREIRASFKRSTHLLLEKGNSAAIATHDDELIDDTLAFARDQTVAADRYEFQMLYGLRPRRWTELVKAGHRFRVYVPFGTHWFPYFTRRLRERKENILFVIKSLLFG